MYLSIQPSRSKGSFAFPTSGLVLEFAKQIAASKQRKHTQTPARITDH